MWATRISGVTHVTRGRFTLSVILAALTLYGLAACGSSSSSSTSTSTSSGTAGQTSTTLSKDEYQTHVVAALQPALKSPSGALNAGQWGQTASADQQAHDQISQLNPPTEVADLHQQLVKLLGAMASDADKIRSDLNNNNQSGAQSTLGDYHTQSRGIIALGQQFGSRGYTQLQ